MKQRPEDESPPAASQAEPDGEADFSVGQYLRSQREMRGISVEELSLRTRIPSRSIERLEAGAFDGEPDGFVRGFVRTVAEGLGLDPDDTLVRMLREPEAARRRGGPRRRGWFALAGVVFVLVAIVSVTQLALRAAPELDTASEDQVMTRQDPVRALAEAQAASPGLLGASPSRSGFERSDAAGDPSR
ncbi:MAG: helix-turn-helix transcriptional regulator [Myxococcota bacterium]|nr:helix-turn-helix transcriptional regulator [Myxococcota bacterium]